MLKFFASKQNYPASNLRHVVIGTATVALLIANSVTQAAVLDFNYNTTQIATSNNFGNGPLLPLGSGSGYISQSYGDVAGVLDVSYRYFNTSNQHVSSLAPYPSGYDELVQVAWGPASTSLGGDRAEVELASVNGNLVTLTSFRLGAWSSGSGKQESVRVFELGNTTPIFDFTGPIGVNNQSNLFEINANSNSGFLIQWSSPWWHAIDNVEHTVVPVPASVWLFASAMAGFLGLRRRA
jgi:hypothetical protein